MGIETRPLMRALNYKQIQLSESERSPFTDQTPLIFKN